MFIRSLPWKIQVPIKKFLTRNSYTLSQAGQDYWVFGEAFNERIGGFFLDIGAHDGITISNTYILEHRYKWSGLCIEANPNTFRSLKKNRHATCVNACLDSGSGEVEFALRGVLGGIVDSGLDNSESRAEGTVIKVKTLPLTDVLREHSAPRTIDYLSIDIEGAEERVLMGFNHEEYRFNCITIERPSDRLRLIFKSHGYILVKEIYGLDCFYVHDEYIDDYKRNLFAFYEKRHLALRWW